MTPLQKATLRASEIRTKLAELAGVEELTDEQRGELDGLRTEYGDVERRCQALQIAEDKPVETRTTDNGIAELRSKVQLTQYVEAACEMRSVAGAEAEFNQELGIGLDRFPLALLAPVEERAVTGTDSGVNQGSWLDRIFAETAAARIGLTFASVAPGVASYPVTTAGGSGVQRGKGEAVGDTAWTVGVKDLKPTRNAVRMTFNMEDAARLSGLEMALTRDLRTGLTESVDKSVFIGDAGATGTDADIAGLRTQADVVEATLTQMNKVKAPNTLAAFIGLIDGLHAVNPGDLRVVASVGSNTLWYSTIANSAAENQTLAGFLMASGINWSVRAGIDTNTANGDFGAFIGRGRGLAGAGVVPVWDSGQLIRDPYSGAAKGEVALTLNYLWSFGLVRPTNFARLKYVT